MVFFKKIFEIKIVIRNLLQISIYEIKLIKKSLKQSEDVCKSKYF